MTKCEECQTSYEGPEGLCPPCEARPFHNTDGSPDVCPETATRLEDGDMACTSCGWEAGVIA